MVMRSLVRAVYRSRDATLVAEKKHDFGNALQNLYRELERAEIWWGLGGDYSVPIESTLLPFFVEEMQVVTGANCDLLSVGGKRGIASSSLLVVHRIGNDLKRESAVCVGMGTLARCIAVSNHRSG